MINWIRNSIVNWLNHTRPLPSTPLSDFQRIKAEVSPGDVILLEGRSRVSEVIKLITQSSWSHAALYIGRLDDLEDSKLREALLQHVHHPLRPGEAEQVKPGVGDEWNPAGEAFGRAPDPSKREAPPSGGGNGQHYKEQWIIESELGLGTVARPLSVYEGEHLRICRPRGLREPDQQRILAHAIGRLGTAYDVRQIFDLARFLFPWFIMPRRWRSTLFSSNPGGNTYTVCSTMIAEAYHSVQFPILPLVKMMVGGKVRLFRRNPKLCVPSDFDYSPYFDIIKYPFLDLRNYGQQQLAPWEGGVSLTDEEREWYQTTGADLPAMYDDTH